MQEKVRDNSFIVIIFIIGKKVQERINIFPVPFLYFRQILSLNIKIIINI